MPKPSDLTTGPVRIVFASGSAEANRALVDRMAQASHGLPLLVVAEFEPQCGQWIPWHVRRNYETNLAAVRAALGGRKIASAAVILAPAVPYGGMRRAARRLSPGGLLLYDEALREVTAAGHRVRRAFSLLKSERVRTWLRRIAHPREAEIPVRARLAQAMAMKPRLAAAETPFPDREPLPEGVSVVIPSRDGRELLERLLPAIPAADRTEIIVSDNGSGDGTADWLRVNYPCVRTVVSAEAVSFARAVNAGLEAARFNRILLLNNDMLPEPGFIEALTEAFARVPDLFCATAQIFFPAGIRREETGKAVWRRTLPLDFPVRCDEPVPGEDLTWVLYGSGGCSLFDAAKLRALGGVSEVYDPAYVEDLDFGYRAWKRGWPTVFCARARVEHRHRATTSRFYTLRQIDGFTEVNYLKFLTQAVGSPDLFRRLWREGIRRLQLMAMQGNLAALDTLRRVPRIGPIPPSATGHLSEAEILALGCGDVAVFAGRAAGTKPTVVIASPYLPFPLSHGGAVRMYNMMVRGAARQSQILLTFCDELTTPPDELLEICTRAILVRRHGSHYLRHTERPDVVEEFDSASFRACLKQTVHQWRPHTVQLEFTQMAQYAEACRPARTVLVEHDITFDLQEQLLARDPANWELRGQLGKWRAFETAAWREVDCVVTMSARDASRVSGARQVACLPNGVDTERYRPWTHEPEPGRLLFIGSFAHKPNVLALEYFLEEVWPLLGDGYTLHVIAGSRPDLGPELKHPRIEVEGFVSDVRPAYGRAEQVLAPLTASAGTNIKVLEAMAMAKVVVSTPAGINGLDLTPGTDILVSGTPGEMAEQIRRVSADPDLRRCIGRNARATAARYDWGAIAEAAADVILK